MDAAQDAPPTQLPRRARALTGWIAVVAVAASLLQALEAGGATAGSKVQPPHGDVAKPRPSPAPLGLRVAVLEPAQARVHGIVEIDGRAVADQQAFWDAMEAARWKPTLGV